MYGLTEKDIICHAEIGALLAKDNSAESRTYIVVKGDSLWSIAKKQLGNGVRYTEIKAINNLTSDFIYPGQVLKIPAK